MPLHKKILIRRFIFALLIVVGVAFTIYFSFFMWRVKVPSGGMMNTIMPGDHLLIHKSFGRIERGDIVAFRWPDDSSYYIMRVIGLPGETIQMRGNMVYINERPLDEQRVKAEEDFDDVKPLKEISTEGNGAYRVFYTQTVDDEPSADAIFGTDTPFQIPNTSFFVVGDNRDNSADSRFRGAVPRELIWGKPSIIYYSQNWERVFKRVR